MLSRTTTCSAHSEPDSACGSTVSPGAVQGRALTGACCLRALLHCHCTPPPDAAAEIIPYFKYSKCLQGPLAPRSIPLQPQTVTLHLHSFEVSQPSQQQNPQGGAAALLQLAVGSPMRCKAVPGCSSGSGGASSARQRMSFGVLTWEQLPGAVPGGSAPGGMPPGGSTVPLEFPAWMSLDQAEPSNVSKQHTD